MMPYFCWRRMAAFWLSAICRCVRWAPHRCSITKNPASYLYFMLTESIMLRYVIRHKTMNSISPCILNISYNKRYEKYPSICIIDRNHTSSQRYGRADFHNIVKEERSEHSQPHRCVQYCITGRAWYIDERSCYTTPRQGRGVRMTNRVLVFIGSPRGERSNSYAIASYLISRLL